MPVFNEGFKRQVLIIESSFHGFESSRSDVDEDGNTVVFGLAPHVGEVAVIRSSDAVQKFSVALSLRERTQKHISIMIQMSEN